MLSERFSWVMAGCTVLLVLLAAFMVRFLPGYLTNAEYLTAIIFLEAMAAVVWNYRQRFLSVLALVFLGAGIRIPIQSVLSSARWAVLAVGALAGLVLYLRERAHWFGFFHAIALSCIVSALASSAVSIYPSIAMLKAVSLLLLFVYTMSGARFALLNQTTLFFDRLLLGLEILLYATAISYFIFHYPLLGNPNSLGALMGVVALPLMLWGTLVSTEKRIYRRRMFVLILALLLLLSSYSRTSIGSALLASILLCFGLRRYQFLVRGTILACALAAAVAVFVPIKSENPGDTIPPIAKFLYKGHETHDVLQSRRSVWDQTMDSIRTHPFFGTGFGTSATAADMDAPGGLVIRSASASDVGQREHGNSYLAIMEWQGLLGVIPFYLMVVLILRNVGRVVSWMRHTGDGLSPSVPLAAVMAAGLVSAGFEDWLFSVGYYLCVFFWTMAFLLVDVLPQPACAVQKRNTPLAASWQNSIGVAAGQ